MTNTVLTASAKSRISAQSLLQGAGALWFVIACIGQWAFCYHIAATYFVTALAGNMAAWNDRLFVGLVAGDAIGNAALIAHLFIAFVITVGGTLQLMPQVRKAAPAFHRWNGRLYMVIAFITSIAALYMVWTRDTFGPDVLEYVVSLNGVLIILFAALAWRAAVSRRFDVHQRWAMRLFMVVSGVWFLRVMYATAAVVTGGHTPGVTDDMGGPMNIVIGFASYLLPLAVLELYFIAKRGSATLAKLGAAALVLVAAVGTGIGVFGTSMHWIRG